jgi:hypothetical protein
MLEIKPKLHLGCLTLNAFLLQQWFHKRASMLLYTTLLALLCYRLVSTLVEYLFTNSCKGYWL